MSSLRQIAANRRNALKSTGPITAEGKENSRGNAVRHGLTAETVIATFEDQDDYLGFQAAVIADYAAETAVERELVLRLASILWRLRRSTGIETALFESMSKARRSPNNVLPQSASAQAPTTQSTTSLCCEQSPHPASQGQASPAPARWRISPPATCTCWGSQPSTSTASAATSTRCGGRRDSSC